jgi:NADH dehydrogenase FAD-containing subunit
MTVSSKLNIIVVGGGYGASTARLLSAQLDAEKYNLILINPLPYRIHLIATARLAVTDEGDFEHSAMLPYDRLFHNGNGTFKQGKVCILCKQLESENIDVWIISQGDCY